MKKHIRIKYTDIKRTFADVLNKRFELPVYDVLEDFPRACFMTELEIRSSERFMTRHIDDYVTMTIYYFPRSPENNTADILIMREELRDLFLLELSSLIPVNKEVPLEIVELTSVVVDKVLQVKIDLNMSHEIIDDRDKEDMEKLTVSTNYDDGLIGKDEY